MLDILEKVVLIHRIQLVMLDDKVDKEEQSQLEIPLIILLNVMHAKEP
jgi:uncharacterized protein YhhL (DUF1145 family)